MTSANCNKVKFFGFRYLQLFWRRGGLVVLAAVILHLNVIPYLIHLSAIGLVVVSFV